MRIFDEQNSLYTIPIKESMCLCIHSSAIYALLTSLSTEDSMVIIDI